MAELYPPLEPYAQGLLDVGDGHRMHWETCGSPAGKAALVVHGGPGSGRSAHSRRYFDPDRYRVVLFDQRGCGRSLPHAADPAVGLEHNTTTHLIADMERLREHLGIDRWLLYGGSWGSTLILAYAQQHPERVSEIVICGVTMTRPEEIDWLYGGAGRLLPAAWDAFRAHAGGGAAVPELLAAYGTLLGSPDPDVRLAAARAWCTWEDSVIAHETLGAPGHYGAKDEADMVAFARLCAHYFGNDAWLEDGALLRGTDRLAGIPAVLIHGRLDLAAPLKTAWELARAWPTADLRVIDEAGHTGSPDMRTVILAALDTFAA